MSFWRDLFKSKEQKEQENKERWKEYCQRKVEKFKQRLNKLESESLRIFVEKANYEFYSLLAEREFIEFDEQKMTPDKSCQNIITSGVFQIIVKGQEWKIERRLHGLNLMINAAKEILQERVNE